MEELETLDYVGLAFEEKTIAINTLKNIRAVRVSLSIAKTLQI